MEDVLPDVTPSSTPSDLVQILTISLTAFTSLITVVLAFLSERFRRRRADRADTPTPAERIVFELLEDREREIAKLRQELQDVHEDQGGGKSGHKN